MCVCVAEAAVCDGVLCLAAVHVHRSAAEDSERDADPQRRESLSLPVFASHQANELAARVNPSSLFGLQMYNKVRDKLDDYHQLVGQTTKLRLVAR